MTYIRQWREDHRLYNIRKGEDKMTQFITGEEALDALNQGDEAEVSNEFTYLKSGNTYVVKVPGLNIISAFVYGSYQKGINSFVAENESKKSAKGFPVDNLTPFDLAWKYYKDKSDDWQDEMSAEANHYRCQRKFTIGFYDLDGVDKDDKPEVKPIMVEFTRNQAKVIVDSIKKYEKRLDQFAFELSKQGSGTGTTVSLSLIPVIEDMTERQQKNFEESPSDFDAKNFEGLHYVMSDEEQVETLTRAGFDISLVGLESPKKEGEKSDGGVKEE